MILVREAWRLHAARPPQQHRKEARRLGTNLLRPTIDLMLSTFQVFHQTKYILIVLECGLFLPSKSNHLGWDLLERREARTRVLLLPGFVWIFTPPSNLSASTEYTFPSNHFIAIMKKDQLLLCAASFTGKDSQTSCRRLFLLTLNADIEIKQPPNKKQYWIRIVVDGKQVFESDKRDPDSSASWKEQKSLCVCYKPIISFRTIYQTLQSFCSHIYF